MRLVLLGCVAFCLWVISRCTRCLALLVALYCRRGRLMSVGCLPPGSSLDASGSHIRAAATTALHRIAGHRIALHYIIPHCIVLHRITLHDISPHCIALCRIALHCIVLGGPPEKLPPTLAFVAVNTHLLLTLKMYLYYNSIPPLLC